MKFKVAIVGGGPASMFLFKRLLESEIENLTIDIFEASARIGAGFPYSRSGANKEHVTNVSGNEIPTIVTPVLDWIKTLSSEKLQTYNITAEDFTDFKVMPRLLFGDYLEAQFELLLQKAKDAGVKVEVHYNTPVTDISQPDINKQVTIVTNHGSSEYDKVVIATGHKWPKTYEGKIPGYFDSPYPPSKLCTPFNHTVAIRGASLTAIDGIRTLSRLHGKFHRIAPHKLKYTLDPAYPDFKLALYSIHGMLPGLRFHLSDSHLSAEKLLTQEEILQHLVDNDGFLSLDFAFEKNFKEQFKTKDPSFYDFIRDMKMEKFVDTMMSYREEMDPFELFQQEYDEAAQSIRRKQSIYWKEMLAILSFAMNYPAKHLSAEDMERYKKVLVPLISIIIAFVPQGSAEELLALHEAGLLQLFAVTTDSSVEIEDNKDIVFYRCTEKGEEERIVYKTFVDCIGQPPLGISDFPFKSLMKEGNLSQARLRYRSNEEGMKASRENELVTKDHHGNYYLEVPGFAITDNFKLISSNFVVNHNLFMLAVPFIGGFNPDYSGLDFCEEASNHVVEAMITDKKAKNPVVPSA